MTCLSWTFAIATINPLSAPQYIIQISDRPILTFAVTLLSSVLATLVAWGFGRSAAYYSSKRVASRLCTLDELSTWSYVGTNRIRWSKSKLSMLSMALMVGLALQVSGFTSLISRALSKS